MVSLVLKTQMGTLQCEGMEYMGLAKAYRAYGTRSLQYEGHTKGVRELRLLGTRAQRGRRCDAHIDSERPAGFSSLIRLVLMWDRTPKLGLVLPYIQRNTRFYIWRHASFGNGHRLVYY